MRENSMVSMIRAAFALSAFALAAPLAAQEQGPPPGNPMAGDTVFDDNWISIGAGGVYSPSYDGSDDYVFSPIPIIQGRLGGIGIDPRPAGLALDFMPQVDGGPQVSAGVAMRLRRNRASRIKDPVVEQYGELDTAFEVGPTMGVSFPGVLNRFDNLTFGVDVLFDVAGAHGGATVSPSVTYFTPLSRAAIASISFSTNWVNDDYANYYYSVPALTTLAPADTLPAYRADSGFDKAGVNLLFGYDLDGDATNGGLALIAFGGYSRMLGDGKNTPFTSIRGSADQFSAAVGIGYTF